MRERFPQITNKLYTFYPQLQYSSKNLIFPLESFIPKSILNQAFTLSCF